jgi:hypothetical protein
MKIKLFIIKLKNLLFSLITYRVIFNLRRQPPLKHFYVFKLLKNDLGSFRSILKKLLNTPLNEIYFKFINGYKNKLDLIRNEEHHTRNSLKSNNSKKKNILFATNTFELTGTLTLALILVKSLSKKYNVYIVSQGNGVYKNLFHKYVCGIYVDCYGVNWLIKKQLLALKFEFCILNSITTWVFLDYCKKNKINSIMLIHEFLSKYKHISQFVKFNADHLVFSCEELIDTDDFKIPQLMDRISFQPQCSVNFKIKQQNYISKINQSIFNKKKKYVLGIGTQCHRKGTDLFIKLAYEFRNNKSYEFLWIGSKHHSFENELFFLNKFIKKTKLTNIKFIESVCDLDNAYKHAFAIALTARLEPFSNIFFDAVKARVPYFTFTNTTGVNKVFERHEIDNYFVSKYLDTKDMAKKIKEYNSLSYEKRHSISLVYKKINKTFNTPQKYTKFIIDINQRINIQKKNLNEQKFFLLSSNHINLNFSSNNDLTEYDFVSNKITNDEKFLGWSRGYYNKKIVPGFNQSVYREKMKILGGVLPIYHYYKSKSKSKSISKSKSKSKSKDNSKFSKNYDFNFNVINETSIGVDNSNYKIGLHLHLFYPDGIKEILQLLSYNLIIPDLFISVDTSEKKQFVINEINSFYKNKPHLTPKIKVKICPNRGRDIAPMLIAFKKELSHYLYIGHMHTKKSIHVNSKISDDWRKFLFSNLLGCKINNSEYNDVGMLDKIIYHFNKHPNVGIIFPDDPNELGWSENLLNAKKLCKKMNIGEDLPRFFNFPVGSMFWARNDSLRQLFSYPFKFSDFDSEPIGIDGTDVHALERLLGIVPIKNGYKVAVTNINKITR